MIYHPFSWRLVDSQRAEITRTFPSVLDFRVSSASGLERERVSGNILHVWQIQLGESVLLGDSE